MGGQHMAEKQTEFIGFPTDLGASCKGCSLGPQIIREAGLTDLITAYPDKLQDLGDIHIASRAQTHPLPEHMKRIDSITESTSRLSDAFQNSLAKGHRPVCLGGDHSLSIGSLHGIRRFYEATEKQIAVIWIDAHPDMNTDQSTISGNIHGMPLAANLGYGDSRLINPTKKTTHIRPENTYLLGIRDIDPKEKELIEQLNIQCITAADIHKNGLSFYIDQSLQHIRNQVDHIHISFDMDVIDPSIAPAVGTPVEGGLSRSQTLMLMQFLQQNRMIDSLDFVEFNPEFDQHHRTAELALEILKTALVA